MRGSLIRQLVRACIILLAVIGVVAAFRAVRQTERPTSILMAGDSTANSVLKAAAPSAEQSTPVPAPQQPAESVESGIPPDTLVYWDGRTADGSRKLVADVPLFSVVVTSTGLAYLGLDGAPHLLMPGSEMGSLTERFPSVPDSVSVSIELVRRIRYVKDGRIVCEEGPEILFPETLDDVFKKYEKAPATWKLP